ncbi:MAG: hypothetical protein LC676_10820 [Loktanella sp.]|nr:hypothetical protein [Loktanella sp.]
MKIAFLIKDAEAAVYAVEAAVSLSDAAAAGDIAGITINLISLLGWTKNAMGL